MKFFRWLQSEEFVHGVKVGNVKEAVGPLVWSTSLRAGEDKPFVRLPPGSASERHDERGFGALPEMRVHHYPGAPRRALLARGRQLFRVLGGFVGHLAQGKCENLRRLHRK